MRATLLAIPSGRDSIRPWRMINFHGVNSDSIRTPLDSFDAPIRRSMKMIGDSTIRSPASAAMNVTSSRNA